MSESAKSETVSQTSMVRHLVEKEGYSHAEAWRLMRIIFGMMRQGLLDGKAVRIARFGSFEMRKVKRRTRQPDPRNPGKFLDVPERIRPFYRPSPSLVQRVAQVKHESHERSCRETRG